MKFLPHGSPIYLVIAG